MPLVSIIVPCYNEEKTIQLLLQAIYVQTFPRSELEVIISDGLSTDRTRDEIFLFQEKHPDLAICIVDNPKKNIPSGLNCGLRAARGDFIVRLDAHSVPRANYVELCIQNLKSGMGDNVGGVWQIEPGASGWISRSIAAAAAHPFGVGDASYRYTTRAGLVDTVPFGAFHRSVIDRIGYFDETLLTNEDYEFNTRLRLHGGKIWIDPEIRSVYFSRPSLTALAKQYWRYGYWKWRMLRRYPASLRWRQAIPPLFVLSLIGLIILSSFIDALKYLLALELVIYFAALVSGSLPIAVKKRDVRFVIGIPAAIFCMHLCWGTGFLWSMIGSLIEKE